MLDANHRSQNVICAAVTFARSSRQLHSCPSCLPAFPPLREFRAPPQSTLRSAPAAFAPHKKSCVTQACRSFRPGRITLSASAPGLGVHPNLRYVLSQLRPYREAALRGGRDRTLMRLLCQFGWLRGVDLFLSRILIPCNLLILR